MAWGGLSPLGRQVIQEMNKWGIMVDVSHPSKGSMMQAIGLSKAPVIASHSSVRKLANHSRNMDDEMLMAMKTNGGVVQMVALSGFVKTDPAERGPAVAALRQEFALPGGRGGGPGAGRGANPAAARPCPVEPAPPGAATGGSPAAGRGATAGLDTLPPRGARSSNGGSPRSIGSGRPPDAPPSRTSWITSTTPSS